jgi:nicotinamidase-related amidase
LNTERSCLILIDWQLGFRDLEYWGPRNNRQAEKNAARLLEHWRGNGWPVSHVAHASTQENSVLRPGHPGHEFEDFAQPRDGEPVYMKSVNSAFIGTSLEHDLRARNLLDLVFCGVSSDHCVSTSVRMAANLGFRPTLVADACYAFERVTPDGRTISAEAVHDAHIASLSGEFAQITTTEGLLAPGSR